MMAIAKKALTCITYDKRPASNLFDDDQEFEGWNFLAAQIY
jgi:hypothetical protein